MSYKYKNVVESGIVKTGFGKLKQIIINSHTSGTLALYDGNEGGAAATTDLTSSGALTVATHAAAVLTSTGVLVPGSHALSVLTGNAIVDGNVMVIGTRTYTFVTALSSNPNVVDEILVGATLTATLLNAKNAINAAVGSGDLRGTTYSNGTVANTQVVATASDATTVTVRGNVPGTSLNSVATTGTALRTVWSATTLGAGTGGSTAGVTVANATVTIDTTVYTFVVELSETLGATAVAYQVLYGGSEAIALDNLKLAINGTGTAGTQYSTGTVAHTEVVATTNTDTAQTIRARVPGTTYNTIATTETLANTAWGGTTLGGAGNTAGVATSASQFVINGRTYTAVIELSETLGAAAIADQILWVTSEAIFLDNIKKAINASGIAGTDYSTGTTQNVDVAATTNTNTVQTFTARQVGTAGNSITTTENMGNYAFTSTVMASGTGSAGRRICNTITFSAVATTGEREIDFGELSFDTSLYATVGGTVDLTFVYE